MPDQQVVRVAAVVRLPAPYRDPLFHKLSQKQGISFHAFFQLKAREGTAWGNKATGVESKYPFAYSNFRDQPASGFAQRIFSAFQEVRWMFKSLRRFSPDLVIIYGYFFPATFGALLWAILLRKNYALRSDSNVFIDGKRGWKSALKRRLVTQIVKRAQSILYIGTANRKYWEKYGATDAQLVEARYAVNDELFNPVSTATSEPDQPVKFLFVGRLIERKNAEVLLRAIKKLAADANRFTLTMIGTGPLEQVVQQQLKNLGLTNLEYVGRVAPDDMPAVYREHDVLICPYEREPWGLTINEAMNCGLAVIAATNGTCGAALDLVVHQENGYGLTDLSAEAVANSIRYMLDQKHRLPDMKAKSLDIISEWSYEVCLQGIQRAAHRPQALEEVS
jgi:glycosyltransferase involved in cell wall biosynthesis